MKYTKENAWKYKGNIHNFVLQFFGMKMTFRVDLKSGGETHRIMLTFASKSDWSHKVIYLRSWWFSRHPYHHMLLMSYVIAGIWHICQIMSYFSDDIQHMTLITSANIGVYRTVRTSVTRLAFGRGAWTNPQSREYFFFFLFSTWCFIINA